MDYEEKRPELEQNKSDRADSETTINCIGNHGRLLFLIDGHFLLLLLANLQEDTDLKMIQARRMTPARR